MIHSDALDYHAEALEWEASRVDMLERSERRAWRIAMVAGIALLLSWAALVLLMPLKEAVPYVLRLDGATGMPELITTLKDSRVGYDEVLDKYWVAIYVRARETYDFYTLQHDYEMVNVLSAAPIAAEYNKQFDGPNALDRKRGNSVRITTEILSIVPTNRGIATVRFARHMSRLDVDGVEEVTRHIATIGFEYRNPSKLRESLRLVNPFGFQALSYRVDPEMIELHAEPTGPVAGSNP